MTENKDKQIRVNFIDDEDFAEPLTTSSKPSTTTSSTATNLPVTQQDAKVAIESLRNLPNDLSKIAESLQKSNDSRKLVIAVSVVIALLISIGGYQLSQEQIKRSLAENSLKQLKTANENNQNFSTTIKDLDETYREKAKSLETSINIHSETLNEQMEVSFKMMKAAYEKREAQLKALIGPKAKELDKITEQYHLLEKSNEVLNDELKSSQEQLKKLYTELKTVEKNKANLSSLPKAMMALQEQNQNLTSEIEKLKMANNALIKNSRKIDASTPSANEEIIQLRAENKKLRENLGKKIFENYNLTTKLNTLEKSINTSKETPVEEVPERKPRRRR